jgi:predicted naringenin-chalcone synthase
LEMVSFSSALLDEGQDDMAWTIGDQGFDLKLSSYVPKIIGSKIKDLISKKLKALGCHEDKIDHWAIHPGGRSIIDKICKELTLDESQVKESREVLRDYGNMSSATILFVLRKLLDSRTTEESKVCSLVFGPGLTVDTILMNLIPSS